MIGNYLNQTCGWKSKTGHDGYEPTYLDEAPILCRWQDTRRMVRDASGVEVVSESSVFCRAPVKANDILAYGGKSFIVISVSEHAGLDGKISHREVYV